MVSGGEPQRARVCELGWTRASIPTGVETAKARASSTVAFCHSPSPLLYELLAASPRSSGALLPVTSPSARWDKSLVGGGMSLREKEMVRTTSAMS